MRTFGAHISTFLSQYAQDEEVGLIFLEELWPYIVGERMAEKVKPRRLQDGMLVVVADSEAWGREVGRLRERLARSVNDLWGCPLINRVQVESASRSSPDLADQSP